MKTMKRALALLLTLVMVFTAAACGTDDDPDTTGTQNTGGSYPQKDINLIIPYAAGGEGDNNYRAIEEKLAEVLDVNVIVEYIGGGNAIPGSQSVLDAPADGYTIGILAAGALCIQPWMGTASYDLDDFQGIANLTAGPILFAVGENQPYDGFDSWLAYAKDNPGAFTVSIGSLGGTPHLGIAKAFDALGVEVTFVPYSGNSEAYAACLSGETGGYVAVDSGIVGKDGIKILANVGSSPVATLEDVPMLADIGLDPGLATDAFFGIVCSKDVDAEIVQYLSDLIGDIMADSSVQQNFSNLNMTPYYLPAGEFNTYMREQYNGYKDIIEALGLAGK